MTGPSGYVNKDLVQQHVAPASLGDKVKVYICGTRITTVMCHWLIFRFKGPPGQVAAIAGKKAGYKQGELAGLLKELGYTESQVRHVDMDLHSCLQDSLY